MSQQNLRDDPLFSVLFNPVRDPRKSWSIDIAAIMTTFLNNCVQKPENVNFVSAALLLQASSNVYGKKVENLYDLANKLAQMMSNIKKSTKSNEATKDKDLHPSRSNPEFALVDDLKRCKNLDMVEERTSNVHNKNAVKYLPAIPPDLIHLEESEKGGINLIDTRGDILGNKKDFFLNICRMHSSGYLLLPTVNVSSVPDDPNPSTQQAPESIPLDVEENRAEEENAGSFDAGDIYDSPPHTPAGENILPSLPDLPELEEQISNISSRRKSLRQVEKAREKETISLEQQKAWQTSSVEEQNEDSVSKKKIQKKNTRKLPKKLNKNAASGTSGGEEELNPTSQFCSKTFFSMDSKLPKNGLLPKNDLEAFDELFLENAQKRNQDLKSLYKEMDPNNEDQNENANSVDSDDDHGGPPVDADCMPNDDDIPIEQSGCLDIDFGDKSSNLDEEFPIATNYEELVRKHIVEYMKDVEQYSQTTDISETVRQWEDNIRPVLQEQQTHEPFDIYVYGKRILDAFADNNRKQVITFQQFCKDKERWQIHRYFLASLQLANNYNIKLSLSNEETEQCTIHMTLLSRKQHHEELANFGHASGSHDP